jgi:hypothetical protein
MPEKAEALGVLLVLLPGFACAYIVQFLAVRRKQTELDKVIEALLFSLFLYLFTLPFFDRTLPINWQLPNPSQSGIYRISVDYAHLATLAGLSILLALLYSANINHDWLMRVFRWMRITERTARSTIWHDAFQEIGGFVQVGLSGERKIVGWVRDYSDDATEASLFLESAAWIVKQEDGKEIEVAIDSPGILLTKETAIEYVIFLGWQRKVPDAIGPVQDLKDEP